MTTDSHSTVEKALRMLLSISEETREIGTIDLGRKLGIHKATVSRILLKLAEYEFVYKNKETGKYWLGPELHHLAMTIADSQFKQVMNIARHHIEELCDNVEEMVSLEVWLGNSTVPVYSAHSKQKLGVTPPPGEPLPLHAAAGAKAVLSFTHSERVEMLLNGILPKLTDHTITDRKLLKECLIEYNKQGFAIDHEELHEGVCGIAAPIFDYLRRPIAAITILVPANKFKNKVTPQLISKLKKKAALVTTELSVRNS